MRSSHQILAPAVQYQVQQDRANWRRLIGRRLQANRRETQELRAIRESCGRGTNDQVRAEHIRTLVPVEAQTRREASRICGQAVQELEKDRECHRTQSEMLHAQAIRSR